jgi:hypothetical protein
VGTQSGRICPLDTFTPTQTGNRTVRFEFRGKTIAEHGVNGPYQLQSLVLKRFRTSFRLFIN